MRSNFINDILSDLHTSYISDVASEWGADYASHITNCPPGFENLTASLNIDGKVRKSGSLQVIARKKMDSFRIQAQQIKFRILEFISEVIS